MSPGPGASEPILEWEREYIRALASLGRRVVEERRVLLRAADTCVVNSNDMTALRLIIQEADRLAAEGAG